MDESRDESCLTQNGELITSASSSSSGSDGWDSDEEDGRIVKYQPLAQDPVENVDILNVNNCSDDDDDRDEVKSKDITEQDKAPTMDEGHANVVVQAMAGFNLSPNNIPEWAKVIPEEVWKNELLAGLKPKKSKINGR